MFMKTACLCNAKKLLLSAYLQVLLKILCTASITECHVVWFKSQLSKNHLYDSVKYILFIQINITCDVLNHLVSSYYINKK